MTSFSITFEGMDEALRQVATERLVGVIKTGLAAVALEAKGKIAAYPPSPGGRPQFPEGFKSLKQQRFFFAALRDGRIEVPYRRGGSRGSQKLGGSWTTQEELGGLAQVIGTAVGYAPTVLDEERQSSYHAATGWVTVQRRAVELEPWSGQQMSAWLQQNVG